MYNRYNLFFLIFPFFSLKSWLGWFIKVLLMQFTVIYTLWAVWHFWLTLLLNVDINNQCSRQSLKNQVLNANSFASSTCFFAYIKKSLMDLGTSHVHDLLSFVIHLCKKTPNLKCMSIKYWRFFVWTCQRKCFTLDLFYTWRKFLLISRWCWKMQSTPTSKKLFAHLNLATSTFLFF